MALTVKYATPCNWLFQRVGKGIAYFMLCMVFIFLPLGLATPIPTSYCVYRGR